MQDAAFILNIFSFLPKRMKHYRNFALIANLIKSAIFTIIEIQNINLKTKREEDITNYTIYSVEGILIQPLLIAGYMFVYRKQSAYNNALI
jgi:hypothetical protein